MKETTFNPKTKEDIDACIRYIDGELEKRKIQKSNRLKTGLLCEESVLKLSEYASKDSAIGIRVRRSLGGSVVEIRAEGEEIEGLSDGGNISYAAQVYDEGDDDIDTGLLILKANEERIKYSYRNGVNLFRISTGKSDKNSMYLTLISLVLSIIVGLLFKQFVPDSLNDGLCQYVFVPIRTMFINALKIIVAPVVFFSIVTCISQFGNLSELGKIGAKVMGMYLITTVLAISMGFLMFFVISPGDWGMALEGGAKSVDLTIDTEADTSLLHTIVNIVPNNLVRPFLESDTLQIIFLAVLLGAAVGMIGNYSRVIRDLFEACNELFLTVTALIAKLIPLVVFCAMFIMIEQTGADSMRAMFSVMGTELLAFFSMMMIYGILILVVARLNPVKFFKKDWPGMLTSFSLSSSNAAMPTNIKICTDVLGISPKVCNFSIPLGATINMDGASAHFAIASMFLAKCYGVDVPESAIFSLVITIIMLSLGTPGVPGASLVCVGILLNQIGVPIEAIGLIMGVDSLLDMFRTASNTTGDVAVTLIVAKTEKLLDIEKYNS